MTCKIDTWQNCYDDSWKDLIVPEAFSHPAKFSRSLIYRIYQHAKEMGWIKSGDYVLDPFGGVALGGLDAISMGLNWIGIELEDKFFKLGEQNIELWQRQLKGWPNLGSARIVQGDSRKLKEVVEKVELIVSSPPYHDQKIAHIGQSRIAVGCKTNEEIKIRRKKLASQNDSYGLYSYTPGNLANLKEGNFEMVVGSPPYAGSLNAKEDGIDWSKCSNGKGGTRDFTIEPGQRIRKKMAKEYGQSNGQLGSMREGSLDAVISSPPYAESLNDYKHGLKELGKNFKGRKAWENKEERDYGKSNGQLGQMKEGSFSCVVSSPPYEDSIDRHGESIEKVRERMKRKGWSESSIRKVTSNANDTQSNYNQSNPDNLGNSSGDTFWSASKEIVQGCFDLLKPGGHAIWVTKSYCKKGQIVDFPGRWKALCESVGFKTICEHRAMLIKSYGCQIAMDGQDQEIEISRKSFFRKLHETKRPDLKINWEMAQCMVKE